MLIEHTHCSACNPPRMTHHAVFMKNGTNTHASCMQPRAHRGEPHYRALYAFCERALGTVPVRKTEAALSEPVS